MFKQLRVWYANSNSFLNLAHKGGEFRSGRVDNSLCYILNSPNPAVSGHHATMVMDGLSVYAFCVRSNNTKRGVSAPKRYTGIDAIAYIQTLAAIILINDG